MPKNSSSKKVSKKQEKLANKKEAIKHAFTSHYEALYGSERWATLQPALERDTRYCCLINKHADKADVRARLQPVLDSFRPVTFCPSIPDQCFVMDSDDPAAPPTEKFPFPSPTKDINNVTTHYLLDAASILATEALQLHPTHTVLDMCAAPGGKSLCIAQRLGPSGTLHSNEPNPDRRKRLRSALMDYIPRDIFESRIKVTGYDASRASTFPDDTFDRVLVDAPCSSERHLLHNMAELETWSPSRTKTLAKKQVLLLLEALRAAKAEGGLVVYATCSLSKEENDRVVSKGLRKARKAGMGVEVCTGRYEIGEKTKKGWIVLPDRVGRWGPLYFCVMRRTGEVNDEEEDEEVEAEYSEAEEGGGEGQDDEDDESGQAGQ
ncbi:NOL1/NOP2/Sun domain member 3 [Rhizophlyctis rosea]|nr:NOL1/NOP2/Sun domain member 3 [Rhizophlyctis rosea]